MTDEAQVRPISDRDEFINHRIPGNVERSADARRAWFDHTEMMIVSSNPSDPVIDSYFQAHRDIRMIHGYTIVLHDGEQHNVRGAREYTDEETQEEQVDTVIGPIKQSVVDPYSRWTFELEPSDSSDISVSAVLVPSTTARLWPCMRHPVDDDPSGFHTVQDVLLQLVTVESGTLSIGDQTWDLTGWQGFRDHCWGYRLPRAQGGPSAHTWLPAFFPTHRGLLMHREDDSKRDMYSFAQIFSDNGSSEEYHDVEMIVFGYEDAARLPQRVEWTMRNENGGQSLRTGTILPDSGTFIAGGWMGESPEEYYGPYRVEADRWTREQRLAAAAYPGLRGMARYRVEYELDGEPGYGLLACFLTNNYQPHAT